MPKTTLVLLALMLLAGPVATQDTETDGATAALAPLHEAYAAARAARFAPGDAIDLLRSACDAYLETWGEEAPQATLVTARTYRIRCLLSAEEFEQVAEQADAALAVEGISDDDAYKLHYYRGIAAIQGDDQEAAERSVAALKPLKPEIALGLLGQVREMWPLVELDELPPQWTLAKIDAEAQGGTKGTVRLEDLRGKYVLMDFWATWCGPCHRVMASELQPLQEKWAGDDRFAMVSVGTNWRGDTAEKQAAMAMQKGYDWTKVFDATGEVTADYGVTGIPALFFLDPEGKVLSHGAAASVLIEAKAVLDQLPPREGGDPQGQTEKPPEK